MAESDKIKKGPKAAVRQESGVGGFFAVSLDVPEDFDQTHHIQR